MFVNQTNRALFHAKIAYLAHHVGRSTLTMAGLAIIFLVLLCMVCAPWLTSHDPNALNLAERL
ncbi:D-ala-D-ala transporter subunit, partial [Pseudomonas avellanae]